MPDTPDIPMVNLSPEDRRSVIAQYLMGNPEKVTGKALAQKFGVSEATITADLKSDEYLKVVDAHIEKFLKGNLIPKALMNVGKDIYAGNIGTSKWLLELTCKYFAQNRAGITLNLGLFTDFQGRLITAVAARVIETGNGNGHYDGNGNGSEDGSGTDIKQLVVYNPTDPTVENTDLESGSVG